MPNNNYFEIILNCRKWIDTDWDGSEPLSLDQFKCPVSKCYLTSNRTLKPVEEYDALVFHETNILFNPTDLPRKRRKQQTYVHHIVEPPFGSALYTTLGKNITNLDTYFNISVNYRQDSLIRNKMFGYLVQTAQHPSSESQLLENIIVKFGRENKQLAAKPSFNGTNTAQFVSDCETISKR